MSWIVSLVLLLISAYVSYASRPKVEPPKPQEADAPSPDHPHDIETPSGVLTGR